MNKSVQRKKRVLVAMSGGVDSSVCAGILKEQGYEVIGMTFKLWSGLDNKPFERACCSIDSVEDARRVSQILDILGIIEIFGIFSTIWTNYRHFPSDSGHF